MAVSYSTVKCTDSCGGIMDYVRERKCWVCRYCGAVKVREESYDGLFTIKNVARQSLVESAYRRRETAEKFLSECENINSGYVGTLLARICLRVMKILTGACSENEVSGYYRLLKEDYDRLHGVEEGTSPEEEIFAEFISENDCAADVFAWLALTFDLLGDSYRTTYYEQMLDPSKVYSRVICVDLLSYALRTNKLDMAKVIVEKGVSLDKRAGLQMVLNQCPDGEEKGELASWLLYNGAFGRADSQTMTDYLESDDSCNTKAFLLAACKKTGCMPDIEKIVRYVFEPADLEVCAAAAECLCTGELEDDKSYYLVEYALADCGEKGIMIMSRLADSNQFIKISGKHLRALFFNIGVPVAQRMRFWEVLKRFTFEKNACSVVLQDYLCTARDTQGSRAEILSVLLKEVTALPPTVIERYALNCDMDEGGKPSVLQAIFAMPGVQPSANLGLLTKYIGRNPDVPGVSQRVIDVMIDAGLPIEQSYFEWLAEKPESNVGLLERLKRNGGHVNANALSNYLERCGAMFTEQKYEFLLRDSKWITQKALKGYLLDCGGDLARRRDHFNELSTKVSMTTDRLDYVEVIHLGRKVRCNLAQAYLLCGNDEPEVKEYICKQLIKIAKMTDSIIVEGTPCKIKKYLGEKRTLLSQEDQLLIQSFKLFPLF